MLGALMLTLGASSALAEVKVAVVDVQRAILNSEEAQRLLQQIQEEFKSEEDEIKKLQADATALLERMQKDSEVMSDAEKRKLQTEIESKNDDFVYRRKKLQKQIEARQQELFAGTDTKVQQAIEALVLEEDYDLILPRQAALYVGDLYDVTRKVTEKLNELDK
ncbi:MAG: OmpH family outer membrane protein [Pseudomonadales bacterium]|nr:OmpH family outer membrane protein [Pseudomonadales bacterium]